MKYSKLISDLLVFTLAWVGSLFLVFKEAFAASIICIIAGCAAGLLIIWQLDHDKHQK